MPSPSAPRPDALGQCGELPAPARRAVVCGIGLGAAATYEEQVSRLLGQGVRGLSPLTHPDGHAKLGRRPPVAPVRLRGTMRDRVCGLRVRRRGHRRGRGAAAPGSGRRGAGRRRRLAGQLRRDVLLHAAGRDEPQRGLSRARLPSLRHRPRRVRHGRGRRVRRPPAARGRRHIGGRAARARSRARLHRRRPSPGGAEPGRCGRRPLHGAGPGRRRRRARRRGARQRARDQHGAQRPRRGCRAHGAVRAGPAPRSRPSRARRAT